MKPLVSEAAAALVSRQAEADKWLSRQAIVEALEISAVALLAKSASRE